TQIENELYTVLFSFGVPHLSLTPLELSTTVPTKLSCSIYPHALKLSWPCGWYSDHLSFICHHDLSPTSGVRPVAVTCSSQEEAYPPLPPSFPSKDSHSEIAMALALLQFVFWVIASLANLASFVVLRGAALLIVALVQLFKIPRQASYDAVEFTGGLIRSALERVTELARDAAVSLASSLFEGLASTAGGSLQLTTSAVAELVEKTKGKLEDMSEVLPQVLEGASEMVAKIADGLWNSYKDAVAYIMDNV
ncbi:unnamed protein product, partial [Musa banksii]